MEYRKILPGDIEALADLLISLKFSRIIKLSRAELVTKLEQLDLQKSSTYIAREDTVVGYINVHWINYYLFPGTEGYISELFVHEDYRGRGIGSRLLALVEGEARQRNCVRLNLLNSREKESYARSFYENHDFQVRIDFVNFVKSLQ